MFRKVAHAAALGLLVAAGVMSSFALAGGKPPCWSNSPKKAAACFSSTTTNTPAGTTSSAAATATVATPTTATPTAATPTTTAPATTTATTPSSTSSPNCTKTLALGAGVGTVLNSLAPGQVACLSSGNYAGDFTIQNSGVTLTAAPGANATISGFIEIADSANDVTISNLTIDGSSSPQNTLQIWGDRFHLLNSEVNGGHSSTTQDCVFIGHPTYGVAYDTVIDHDRIHGCGASGHGHGFYVKDSRGQTEITNNYIYDNTNFNVQFYDDGDGVDFEHNVLDGAQTNAGLIFAGESSSASDNDTVRYNILTNNATYGITSYWGSFGVGTGNVADHNCFFGNGIAPIGSTVGWTNGAGNVFADPLYVDRASKDFRLRAGSPCAGEGPS